MRADLEPQEWVGTAHTSTDHAKCRRAGLPGAGHTSTTTGRSEPPYGLGRAGNELASAPAPHSTTPASPSAYRRCPFNVEARGVYHVATDGRVHGHDLARHDGPRQPGYIEARGIMMPAAPTAQPQPWRPERLGHRRMPAPHGSRPQPFRVVHTRPFSFNLVQTRTGAGPAPGGDNPPYPGSVTAGDAPVAASVVAWSASTSTNHDMLDARSDRPPSNPAPCSCR